ARVIGNQSAFLQQGQSYIGQVLVIRKSAEKIFHSGGPAGFTASIYRDSHSRSGLSISSPGSSPDRNACRFGETYPQLSRIFDNKSKSYMKQCPLAEVRSW